MVTTRARYVPARNWREDLDTEVREELVRPLTTRVALYANQDAPGSLSGSVKTLVVGTLGFAYTDKGHWVYVELGTRAHPIDAEGSGVLRWEDEETGEVRYAKSVWHPGTTGNPVMRRALLRALREVL